MRQFARVQNNTFVEWIYKKDFEGNFPEDAVEVEVLPYPEISELQIARMNSVPELIDGTWKVGWTIGNKTLAEVLPSLKMMREESVCKIKVTTVSGNTFDGNEISQDRMSRAVSCMDDLETIPWVLADSSIIMASKAELKEALRLSGAAMNQIWVQIYSMVQ